MPTAAMPSWPGGVATGVGSMPGTDVRAAVSVVAGELPDLPHLPELPGRGPGADVVGRTAVLLAAVSADLAVETTPTGWRFADGPGRDVRRGAAFWREDLDAVEEGFAGVAGPVKSQLCGPWTLAAAIELRSGQRALRDAGAVRDIASALAEAAAEHVAGLRRRLPGAEVLLCVDEPSLPAVRRGSVPTASGLARIAAVPDTDAVDPLATVLSAAAAAGALPMLHCCDPRPPVALAVAAGARALSVDLGVLDPAVDDELAATVERGTGLLLGVVDPPADAAVLRRGPVVDRVNRVRSWWRRLGFAEGDLTATVCVSPGCGLAGATGPGAVEVLGLVRDVARALREDETPAR